MPAYFHARGFIEIACAFSSSAKNNCNQPLLMIACSSDCEIPLTFASFNLIRWKNSTYRALSRVNNSSAIFGHSFFLDGTSVRLIRMEFNAENLALGNRAPMKIEIPATRNNGLSTSVLNFFYNLFPGVVSKIN